MVTNKSHCFFVVYTFVDIVVINVFKNENFVKEMLKKLVVFYEKFLKPAVLNKYFYRDDDTIFCKAEKTKDLKEETEDTVKRYIEEATIDEIPIKHFVNANATNLFIEKITDNTLSAP